MTHNSETRPDNPESYSQLPLKVGRRRTADMGSESRAVHKTVRAAIKPIGLLDKERGICLDTIQ
jgi:hypothetical protein